MYEAARQTPQTMARSMVNGNNSHADKGFAYITLLLVLAVMAITLTAASQDIAQTAQREREVQLLFVGKQFRNAIASYYEKSPQGNKQYPQSLEMLMSDNRHLKPAHHLRKIYLDPMRNSAEWGLVKNEQDQIIGVYSLSNDIPIKTNVDENLQQTAGEESLKTYADWKFIYQPTMVNTDESDNADMSGSNEVTVEE
ncbi:MAG: type II secretion system protein [Methylotenera sp.]|nr:type II secretion system protein [Methylotenera sp.]